MVLDTLELLLSVHACSKQGQLVRLFDRKGLYQLQKEFSD